MVTINERTMLNCQDTQKPQTGENNSVMMNTSTVPKRTVTIERKLTGSYVPVIELKAPYINNKNKNNTLPDDSQSLEDPVPRDNTGVYEYCQNCKNTTQLCEHDNLIVFYRNQCKSCTHIIQGSFFNEHLLDDYSSRINNWLYGGEHLGKSFIGSYLTVPTQYEPHVNLLEDASLLMFHMIRSRNNIDRCVAVVNFCKLRGSRMNLLTTLLELTNSLFKEQSDNLRESDILERMGYVAQNDDEEDSPFAKLRATLGMYDKMKELPIYKKLHKFFMYILCSGMLKGTNINFRSCQFDKFEEEALKRTHKPGFDMVHSMLDTIIFICEAGHSFFKTGKMDKFLHSGSSYEKWLKTATKLKMQSKFLNNPEPHGINRFAFVSELKDTIEKGKSIIRFTGGLDKSEKLFLQKTLCDLQLIEAEETTKRSAQQPRKDPFGILIHGSSHIAKSKLTEIMFKHYGKCFGLPIEDNYRYTRCPTDEYWSGFDSTQWCIVMDDIAFLAPTGEVDPTLKELLQVKNSVPYTPPQAALEDKGRTPVKAELLIATTNTKHLNLHAYFACPFAIARRLSYVVTPTVKQEYVKDGFMVDSKLIPPTPEGEYMNIWDFTVSVPKPESMEAKDNQRTRYEVIERFDDIESFLQWYIFVAEEHANAQSKADKAAKTMHTVEVCLGCKRSKKNCFCGTEWEHKYQKCVLCDHLVSSCICEYSEQVDVDDFNVVYKTKLAIMAAIVDGQYMGTPQIICDYYDAWFHAINTLFLMLLAWYPMLFIVFAIFLWLFYKIYQYSCIMARFYYQWKYGYSWKFRLLFSVCGNEYDTYRLLFRIAGDKVKAIKNKENYLYGFGVFLALPATVYILRKLWVSWFPETPASHESIGSVMDNHHINHVCKAVPNGPHYISVPGGHDGSHYDSTGKVICGDDCDKILLPFFPQGNVGTIPIALPEEKKTFYYHDPYATTPCEISGASKCAQGDLLTERIKLNTARFNMRFPAIGRSAWTSAVNFHGSLWMLNKHSVKDKCGIVDIMLDDTDLNVSRNMFNIAFSSEDWTEIPNSDIIIIELRSMSPAKSLLQYFPVDEPLGGIYKGHYIKASRSGVKSLHQISNVRKGSCPIFGVPCYMGVANIPTENGDCGSLFVAEVGTAQVILGFHATGAPTGSISMHHISQKMLQAAIEKFEPQVLEGELPISAPGYERNLGELHTKSCLRWLPEGTAKVYGSFKGYRPCHKSKVEPTYFASYAVKHGYKADYVKPAMDWRPWHLAIKDMTTPIHSYYNSNIKKCGDAFFDDIFSQVKDQLHMLEVYSLDVALNGADGITYVDKLNCSTSAGNPFKKTKKAFLTQVDGKVTEVHDLILDRIKAIEYCYDHGIRYHPQFCGHLKDEPVSQKKFDSGKTRVFTGGEMAWAIVVRQYLLSFIRLIQNNPYAFEAMPGVVAQSTEWRDLFNFVTFYGRKKIIAGDYGKFDKRMAAAFILEAFRILERLAGKAGWPEKDIMYIRCIARDTAFANIDFNGDLIEIQGNPSGHPLTVIINCLVNSLYMRYAYMLISGKPLDTFQQYVHLATYGDDNIMGVSDECPNFNHTRIAAAMKCIGVDYTMAEKEAASVPYIDIKDATFLKRSFVYDEDVGCIIAPLDVSSFDKMMTARLPKADMATEAHAVCVIETAQREYFFHGKEKFLERQKFFRQLVEDCGLQSWVRDSTFPEYYNLVYDFWMRYDDEENANKYSLRETTHQTNGENHKPSSGFVSQSDVNMTGQSIKGSGSRGRSACCTLEPNQVSVPSPVSSVISSSSGVEEMDLSYDFYSLGRHMAQSEDIALGTTEGESVAEENAETVTFLEKANRYSTGFTANLPPGAMGDATSGADLHDFLQRPVLINTYTWNESDPVGTTVTINPWQLFFNNTSIKNKLTNYAWLKCDLKIKILVNASPFYFGTTLVSYHPLPNFHTESITKDGGTRYFIPYSQRPHVWIYPQNNEGGEMTLPYLWPKNWISTLVNQDFIDMGQLTYFPVVTLQSANGVTAGGVTISTYAWAENVVLSGPTTGLVMQSDEYSDKPISSVATAISKAAGALSGLPMIGKFMTATQIGARTVASVAASLGFSNPPVIDNAMPVKIQGLPQLASPEISYPIEKLTIDPKNELTVDPSCVGIPPNDELSIQHLVGKESYLCTFPWSSTDSADALLFNSAVTPVMFDLENVNTKPLFFTPMGWVSNLFNHWRGDLIFRFRFICTQYHRGRVRIMFDPSGSSAANILNTTATQSTVFNEIVDLTKDTNVEVRVPYQQALAWCTTFNPTSTSQIPFTVGNSTIFNHVANTSNGLIAVRVVTGLTSPILASTIQCIVSVRGAENLEFANPSDIYKNYSYFVAQSDEYEETECTSVIAGHKIPQLDPNRYLVNFGEQIVSIRQMLRRFQWYRSTIRAGTTSGTVSFKQFKMYKIPPFYGYQANGWDTAKGLITTATTYNMNVCGNTYLHWILPAFIGQRGSINYSIVQDSQSPAPQFVTRQPNTTLAAVAFSDYNSATGGDGIMTIGMKVGALNGASSSGMTGNSNFAMGSITWQMPNYSAYKFNVSSPANFNATISQDDSSKQSQVILTGVNRSTTGTNFNHWFVGAGTDFMPVFFLNVPTVFVYSGDPLVQ